MNLIVVLTWISLKPLDAEHLSMYINHSYMGEMSIQIPCPFLNGRTQIYSISFIVLLELFRLLLIEYSHY